MALKEKFRNGIRILLKYTLNPLTRRLAHSSFGPFSIIQHIGRRSGKQYETPIIVAPAADGFVIELTYGPDVDWYKNVLAADGCTVIWHGKDYMIDRIEPVDTDIGRAAFPLPARLIFRLVGLKHFVKMSCAASQ